MAFPASDTHKILAKEMDNLLQRTRAVREVATSTITALAAGPASAEKLLTIAEEAQMHANWLQTVADVPGIGAYAAANLSPTVTAVGLAGDFDALIAALEGVTSEVAGTFSANGYLNDPPLVNGVRSLKEYSVAQTADLRAALQVVADAVA